MRKVPHRDLPLLIDRRQKRSLVIDLEREDAVLVGRGECRGEDRTVGCRGGGGERNTVKRGQHAKFELKGVGGRKSEGGVVCAVVLADFDGEFLEAV